MSMWSFAPAIAMALMLGAALPQLACSRTKPAPTPTTPSTPITPSTPGPTTPLPPGSQGGGVQVRQVETSYPVARGGPGGWFPTGRA